MNIPAYISILIIYLILGYFIEIVMCMYIALKSHKINGVSGMLEFHKWLAKETEEKEKAISIRKQKYIDFGINRKIIELAFTIKNMIALDLFWPYSLYKFIKEINEKVFKDD